MTQFITLVLNLTLLLTASIWLPIIYVVNALTGHESSEAILSGEHFILEKFEE
jgi:hypothetical protein